MTQINDDARFETQHAARSFTRLKDDALANLRKCIASARRDLDEAERALNEDRMPNTCGILQTRATNIEMAIGRLAALRDADHMIATFVKVLDAAASA